LFSGYDLSLSIKPNATENFEYVFRIYLPERCPIVLNPAQKLPDSSKQAASTTHLSQPEAASKQPEK
jgi:hypothetical protein